ncbi:hypothetical protein HPB50_019415 [Hyalomma asiaticum]|uniref:Uncharacterized protein n=1 Tax=Hyalomma asiaticum TaxID=266040 RepID=A0ACB7RLV8_HYAAI|nr:hypothetical protein HPB50_019415 [Hyalomma asiaticum]
MCGEAIFAPFCKHDKRVNRRTDYVAQKTCHVQRRWTRNKNNATKTEVQRALSKLDLSELEAVAMRKDLCGRLYPSNCNPSDPYRTLDGSCNNIEHPSWGKALSCHSRIAPPVYLDGERTAAAGIPRPGYRCQD